MEYTFTHLDTGNEISLTGEDIQVLAPIFGNNEVLADILTGYNCDTYADAAEDLAVGCEGDADVADDPEYGDPETYQRVRAWHRLLNAAESCDEVVEKHWREDFHATGTNTDD